MPAAEIAPFHFAAEDNRAADVAALLLGARDTYRQSLQENVNRELAEVQTAFRDEQDKTVATRVAQSAVVTINSYQIWESVLSHPDIVTKTCIRAYTISLAGCLVGAGVYLLDDVSWSSALEALGFLGIALSVATVSFGVLLALSWLPLPRPRLWRNACAIALFSAAGYAIFYAYRWDGFLAEAILAGATSAVVVLFVLAVMLQITRAMIGAMYRYSWSTYPALEITQSLASAAHYLNQADIAARDADQFATATWYQTKAASTLDHVAFCITRYLPTILAWEKESPLREGVLPHLQGVAAEVRRIAVQCVLRRPGTNEEVRLAIAGLLVSSAQGNWGMWPIASTTDSNQLPGRRFSTRNITGVLGRLAPIVAVAVGILVLYLTDPKSDLLDPDMVGPLTAAVFAYLTTMIVNGINPKNTGPTNHPPSPARAAE